jgi:alkaline phosphatase
MSTFATGGGYDPNLAWEDFDYVKSGATDSAAAATALSTGLKTYSGAIGVDTDRNPILNIIERAEEVGKATAVWKTLINNGIGNVPGMEWYSRSHTNSLIHFYAKDRGAKLFKSRANGHDPVRGYYIDNTDIAKVIFALLESLPTNSCLNK